MALLWLPREMQLARCKVPQTYHTGQLWSLWGFPGRFMDITECTQQVPTFVKTFPKPQKSEGEVRLFRVVGKSDWLLPNFLYCYPCLGRYSSCQWSGKYTEGLVPPGTQVCTQVNCSHVRGNSDVRYTVCLQPHWSAQTLCLCPGFTYQTDNTNKNNLRILPICHLQKYLRQLKFTLEQKCHKATNVCSCHELTILYLARLEFPSAHSSTPFPIQVTPWRNTLLRYFKTDC